MIHNVTAKKLRVVLGCACVCEISLETKDSKTNGRRDANNLELILSYFCDRNLDERIAESYRSLHH